jgi:predicted O-linked N-acetylglucosamine transferase (SPINDLY family)
MTGPGQTAHSLSQLLDRAIACHRQGQLAQAEALYQQILRAQPRHFDARHMLGVIRYQQGRNAEALELVETALKLSPRSDRALSNQGLILYALRRYEEALRSFDKALAVEPTSVDAINNRGNTLQRLKRNEEALKCFDQVLARVPGHIEALNNRGNALQGLKHYDEAVESYQRVLKLRPNYPDALYNCGCALSALGKFSEALQYFNQAQGRRPDHAETQFSRADALNALKRHGDAIAGYEKAIALRPDHPYAYSGLAEAALSICDWARTTELLPRLETLVAERKAIVNPFTLIRFSDKPALHLQCARSFIADKVGALPAPLWTGERWSHERIRVAYLSADFHQHATAYLIAELIERHDRDSFEIIGISFGRDDGSDIRRRVIGAFDRVHATRSNSDREVAQLLRENEIDIAVDLKGYTQESRPEILAFRPAPIQASYLGYPGSMGADFIDYIIADHAVIPPEQAGCYSEKIAWLPDSYQCNDRQRAIADMTPSRQEAGLPPSGFVFCCFNNNYKITPAMFDVWMRLLQTVPGSVLWLLRENVVAEGNLQREAKARGVDPARLVFADRMPLAEHLARHRLADLFLDTLPYNAHTTASDALWAGLPVLTCQGMSFAARVASSLLTAVGLPELVTTSLADYEALALRLATDPRLIGELRARLAANRLTHPLFDTSRFCRHIEAAYATMWETWQRGEAPQSFAVEVQPD